MGSEKLGKRRGQMCFCELPETVYRTMKVLLHVNSEV